MLSGEKSKISVVLNTRNRCRLLHRSIESALNQTYSQIEIIVVDGASTDDTKLVVDRYIKKDPRVKYLFVPDNKNAAYCINLGFESASGKYVAILDDDDEFYPQKLEKQLSLMEEDGGEQIGIVYCWEEFWDDETDKLLRYGKPAARGALYLTLLEKPCTGGGTTMLIRKKAIEEVGGYDESIRFGSDYQFNLNVSKKYKHDFVPEILVRTHWNHQYVTQTTQPGGIIDYDAVIEYYEKILTDHRDAYDKNPQYRYNHYRSIMHSAAKAKNYKKFYEYLGKGLSIKNPFKEKAFYCLRGAKKLLTPN